MTGKKVSVENLTFEAALAELQEIVKSLESGQTALEDSIEAYERGAALREYCRKKLTEAQARIETISMNSDGTATTALFAEQEQ